MLTAGTRLGPYEIISSLGAGGMGEVYKARDTRLGRLVAIKILPSADPERRARFIREARAVAALSHPNICVLHDIGTETPSTDSNAHPIDFIVIEYLGGESMADRLRAGPLPAHVAIDLAVQIADALDAAHAAGIVHRDLKPRNLFITQRGQAKVLDFGIAKLSASPDAADEGAQTMTAFSAMTSPGTALGTVAYMSPEQARGEETDARSDLFSFGVVLYEMTTGRPPFAGRTTAVIVDELLNKTPAAPETLNPAVTAALSRVIVRALDKDLSRRYQRAADMRTDLEALGTHPLRDPGLARPALVASRRRRLLRAAAGVGVVLVGLAVAGGLRWLPRSSTSGPIDSIAVLPFVNESGTPDADYLSDGLAETLTNNLTRVPGLRVVPRTLAVQYKNNTTGPAEVGKALNARAIVSGRVTQRGDRLTVQAELIDAASVSQLWGDRFDRPLADILSVQADISRAITENLRLHMTKEDQQQLSVDAPKDAVAYQLYLKGRYETNKRTAQGYATATRLFEQAITQDSRYARAHAGLADVYLWQAYWGYLRAADTYPKATTAANQALALDPRSAEAHATLGWLNMYHLWNWTESARHYERALSLDPASAVIRAWYGESLSARGRHDEAIAEVRRAAALDPLSPHIKTSLAFVLSNARRYDEAIVAQQAAIAGGPESTLAQLDLARVYRLSGRHDLAVALSRRMLDTGDPLGPAFLAASYARAGRRSDAIAIVRSMEEEARRVKQGSYLVGMVYAALADRDRAFRWLDAAYQERDTFLPWLKVDPEFDSLRGDPRFDDLLRRIGIPDQ